MAAFTMEMTSPFRGGWTGGLGGPGEGGHSSSKWYIQYGMDLGAREGTEVLAAFAGHVTVFHGDDDPKDSLGKGEKEYGNQLFLRYGTEEKQPGYDLMGAFYTHITGRHFSRGNRIEKGQPLGTIVGNHLHLALVEIIGGPAADRYTGVNLYQHFVAMADTPRILVVTFKQDGSAPSVSTK